MPRRIGGGTPLRTSGAGSAIQAQHAPVRTTLLLYLEGHRVVPSGVLDDELVLPVLRWRKFHRTLRAGRVVLADFLAGLVVGS
jgi:hypothetical protein